MDGQTTKAIALALRLGEVRRGELVIDGVPIGELAGRYGTPLYAYSGNAVVQQVQRVRRALAADTDLCFSVKANPSLGLCQLLASESVGAEVASIGELLLAQRAGFAPGNTLFAGPGKTDAELEEAVRWGVFAVNVESPSELERLARIATQDGRVARAALRINPTAPLQGARMRMGGGPQQFGIDEETMAQVAAKFRDHPFVDLSGLHVYAGTQVFDVEALLAHFHHTVDLAQELADVLNRPLAVVDFGGGFGVPYFEGMPEFELVEFAKGFRDVLKRCKGDQRLRSARLVVELGRFLTAEAGLYVTRVVDIKQSHGRTFIITDGGMNHHIMATGNFGQVFRKPYPLAVVNRMNAPKAGPVTIAGPCCTPLDILANQVPFPAVQVGDLVGVFYSGAYGYSASSLAFLSHPTPAEVLLWNGQLHVLRHQGRSDQVLEGQMPLNEALAGLHA